jgi:beta-N-acetylhexosaminidase
MTERPASRIRALTALLALTVAGGLTASTQAAAVPPPTAPPPAEQGWVMSTLRHMSLEEKVGQLFVTYAYGSTATTVDARNRSAHGVDTPAQLVERYHLGGVIYFSWSNNLNTPRQVAELSNGLQQTALNSGAGLPLLISTDHEMGIVTRAPATQFPGSMALGAGSVGLAELRDQPGFPGQDARAAAAIEASELRAMGINVDYAPVADVNVNPNNPVIGVRSFGADPQLAADLTAAQVEGFENANPLTSTVSSTAKHFPGHGDTALDSHTDIPVITHTLEQWRELDAPPFQAAIAAGIDSIMTAHIVMPELDPTEDPATLSRPIMTGLLREQLGFDGVVVTDSLGMVGVREKYGDDRVPVLALQAGVDMLLMPPSIELAYNSVLQAVRDGELTERRIDESVARILRMKWRRGVVANPLVDPGAVDSRVSTPQNMATAQAISDRAITALRDETNLLPLPATSPTPRSVLVTGWGVSTTQMLATRMAARGWSASSRQTGSTPDASTIASAVAAAQGKQLVVVLVNTSGSTPEAVAANRAAQRTLTRALVGTGVPVVAVAVRDAYDAAHVAEARAWLATYNYTPMTVEALAKVLHGEIDSHGRLPVSVPKPDGSGVAYPFGYGLDLRQ